jgi:hypothetical protein
MDEKENDLTKRLKNHLELGARMGELPNVVDNARGNCKRADDDQNHVMEELRKMENESMSNWVSR